jgi:predicted transcriptional regulator
MNPGFVEALAAAAKKAREDSGVSVAELAGALGKTEDSVRNFEDARTFLGLNDYLAAYDARTESSLFDLLDAAAKATLKTKG